MLHAPLCADLSHAPASVVAAASLGHVILMEMTLPTVGMVKKEMWRKYGVRVGGVVKKSKMECMERE